MGNRAVNKYLDDIRRTLLAWYRIGREPVFHACYAMRLGLPVKLLIQGCRTRYHFDNRLLPEMPSYMFPSSSFNITPKKHAAGGYVSGGPQLSWLAEEGWGEFIIPTNPSRRADTKGKYRKPQPYGSTAGSKSRRQGACGVGSERGGHY